MRTITHTLSLCFYNKTHHTLRRLLCQQTNTTNTVSMADSYRHTAVSKSALSGSGQIREEEEAAEEEGGGGGRREAGEEAGEVKKKRRR